MHRGIRDTSANYKLWLEYRNGEREKEEGKEAAAAVRDPLDTLLVASSPLTYSWQRFNVCTAQPSPYAVHGWAGRLGGLLTDGQPLAVAAEKLLLDAFLEVMVHKLRLRDVAYLPHLGVELGDHPQNLSMLRMALIFHDECMQCSAYLY